MTAPARTTTERVLPEPRDEADLSETLLPTEQDHENARIRQEIAERQRAEYVQVLDLALDAFGPGWFPSHRHFLVQKDAEEEARRTGKRPKAAATVFTVKNEAGEARHFSVRDGKVVEHANYQEGFGSMLFEPHPTQGFYHRGEFCRIHRYSLCWAPYELYQPRTADELATLRASREKRKSEREERRWAETNPLFAWADLRPDE
jgi:hypothetical protein